MHAGSISTRIAAAHRSRKLVTAVTRLSPHVYFGVTLGTFFRPRTLLGGRLTRFLFCLRFLLRPQLQLPRRVGLHGRALRVNAGCRVGWLTANWTYPPARFRRNRNRFFVLVSHFSSIFQSSMVQRYVVFASQASSGLVTPIQATSRLQRLPRLPLLPNSFGAPPTI